MLILKQNAANTVPTPPAGKGTIFLNTNDDLSVKSADGNVTVFPTAAGANTQVYFNDEGSFGAVSNLTFNKTTSVFTVTGNVAATNVLTDNLLYANGAAWDLSDPGGANTQIQFNDDESFGGSAAFTFNKSSNLVTVQANLNANNLNATTHITSGNVWANSGTIGAATLKGEGGNISNIQGGNVSGTVATATTAGTVTTAAQPNITSVGTLTSVAVTGNVTAGNVYANSGTIGAGTLKGEGGNISNIQAANVSGTVATASTVTTAAQPNITSVGTLTSLTVTGNTATGNLTTGGVLSAVGNVSGGNITTGGVVSATGNVSGGNLTTAGVVAATGNVSGGNLTTAGALSVTGNANIGNIGAAAGVFTGNVSGGNLSTGGSLNVSGNAIITGNLTVDGNISYVNVETLAVEDPVISLGAGPNNTPLTQNDGKDRGTLLNYFTTTPVYAFMGWDNGNSEFAFGSNVGIVNDVISYNALGNVRVGNIIGNGQALTGLAGANVTGQVANALVAGTVYTAAQPNITSVGTLTSVAVTGNATAGNVYANSGTIGASLLTGTLTTAAQPNVTSVGTLTSLAVTGNASAGNLNTAGKVVASTLESNVATGTAPFVVASTTKVTNLNADLLDGYSTDTAATANTVVVRNADGNIAANNISGTLTTASQTNITSVGTLGSLAVTGNATAGNVYANSGTIGATNLTGTLTTAAQPNITSVGTLGSLAVTGNATAGNVYANSGTIGAQTLKGEGGNISNIQGANVSGTVATATTAGTVTTAAQPNITSVGTLTSLAVTGNVTAANFVGNFANGNSDINIPAANGNINFDVAGTANVAVITATGVNVSGTLNSSGNANVGNLGTAGLITATGNVSGGNLTTAGAVVATGNVSGGNLSTAGVITATGNLSAGNVNTTGAVAATGNVSGGNLTTTGVLSVTGTGVSSIAGNLDMTSNTIINLATPTNPTDAATKQYVDDVAQGLNIHDSVQAATPNTLAVVTGGTITYNNGSSGVGANLTTTGSFNLIDGVNVQTAGTRILVKNEANAVHNGIYTWSNATVITRATDYDTVPEVEAGDFVFVTGGTLYDNTGWVQTSSPAAIGTAGNTIDFTQFSGAGTYNAGTGLTLSGTTFSISNTAVTAGSYGNGDRVATFTVNAQGQLTAASNVAIAANAANLTGTVLNSSIVTSSLTSVGTLGSLSVTGKVTAGQLQGDGGNISNIQAANVSGTVSSATTAGTVTTAAQPNITSVGTLTSLTVTGNTTSGNFVGRLANGNSSVNIPAAAGNVNISVNGTANVAVVTATGVNVAGTLNATGNANVGNIGATRGVFTNIAGEGGNISNIQGANVSGTVSSATTAGTVTTAAQPNITSVGTLTSLTVTGNITGGNLIGPHANGNSNVNIPAAAGNVNISVNGTANVAVVTATGVNVAGTLNATGNANVGNIGATNGVFTNVSGNGSALTAITGGNVTGQVGNALVAGTVYTAAQPNITSVGTLTSLTVTGNASAGNLNTAGAVVASTLTSNVATGTAPLTVTSTTRVANLNVAYANVADFVNVTTQSSGNAYLMFANALTGNVSETANATFVANTSNGALYATTFVGALSGAATSATTAGTVTTNAQPNITSVGTLTSLAVTGNITGGNLIGPHANGNSNVNIPAANGNVNISAVGNANILVVTGTGVNVAGTLNATGAGTIGGDLAVSGNATVTGNLYVNGNLTYLNVETVAVEDPIINLQTGANGAAPVANSGKDVGSALNYYDTQARIAFMGWDVSNAEFGMASVATIASEVVTFTTYGNLRVGNIIGNGQALTGLAGANVTGQVANALVAGTVYTAAQPNITSVGTLTSVAVTGNATAGNVYANAGTIGAGTGVFTTANLTTINSGLLQNGNSNVTITANGNVTIAAVGGARITATSTGANVTGTLGVSGNANVGNLGTAGQLISSVATGTAPLVVTSTTQVANLNVATAGTAGTVTTAAQPNITSVGTLTSLTSSGNISGANVISSAYSIVSVGTGISAAGTVQGNATVITKEFNVVSTVASGAGVVLPTAVAGMRITVINTSANALLVYPASTGIINSAAANAAYSQPAGARLDYISTSTTQWYTLNATYG